MFPFRKNATPSDLNGVSQVVTNHNLLTENKAAGQSIVSTNQLNDDLSKKMASLGREYDSFTERFSADLGRIGRHFSKISSDNQMLTARMEKVGREHASIKELHAAASARIESLDQDRLRLTAELALVSGKLNRSLEDHRFDRELLTSLQMRNEALDIDYARTLIERDKHQNELISTRHDVNELAQKHDQIRAKLDQSDNRFSNLETRNRILEIEVQNHLSEIESYRRSAGEIGEKTSLYTSELSAANERIVQLEIERDASSAARERLSSQCAGYVTKIEEMRRQFDASIDGLSRTKAFLWENSEKQRRQMADQSARISQLEQSNSNLSKILSDSSYEASKNMVADVNEANTLDNERIVSFR